MPQAGRAARLQSWLSLLFDQFTALINSAEPPSKTTAQLQITQTALQLHSNKMSCLGIDVSSTVQGSELDHITVEGIEATDALGRAICQSQLTVRCEGVAPLNLDLKLSPDDLEPVFSGAAWAGTVLWRAAAVLVDRAFLGADAVQIKGRTCIELGCGLGVPGMACARLGAKNVALTEQQLDLCGNQ